MESIRDFLFSDSANHAAADLLSRVSGGLGMEIIRIGMNHNGSAYDLPDPESVCEKLHMCLAAAG